MSETFRGKWVFPTLKRNKRAHLMSDETTTFCGRTLLHARPADQLGSWDPEEHPDSVCQSCLEWWRVMKPKPPAPTRTRSKPPA